MKDNINESYRLILGASRKGKQVDIKKFHMRMRRSGARSAPEVMLKITSFGGTKEETKAHMNYVSRNGKVPMYDPLGNEIDKKEAIEEMLSVLDEQEERSHGRTKRNTMHFILSMPPGTNKEGFQYAVNDFLDQEFGANHDYFYAFHDDSDSYHAHVVMAMEGKDFTRLDPHRSDLARWRMEFSDRLHDHGIMAQATTSLSRGQVSKNLPTYKFKKNIGRVVEHGEAPYKGQMDANPSYFVLLDLGEDEQGMRKTKTVWSKSLKEPMMQAEVEGVLGDNLVKLQKTDIEKVSFEQTVYDKDGKKAGTEEVNYDKTTWEIKSGEDVLRDLGARKKSADKVNRRYIDAWRDVYENAKEMGDNVAAQGVVNTVMEAFSLSEQEFTKEKSRSKGDDFTR